MLCEQGPCRKSLKTVPHCHADDTIPMTESEEELKSLLKVKEESEKVGLKLNIHKTKIMAPGPIISWQIEVENVENSDRFYLLGLQNHCG